MYKIIYMKADYEPWWLFEGWESSIISTDLYDSEEEFQNALSDILKRFRNKYQYENTKDSKYYAFWSDEEREFCEACDDDLQIYHGIIVEKTVNNKI